jgi:hypothetical protein
MRIAAVETSTANNAANNEIHQPTNEPTSRGVSASHQAGMSSSQPTQLRTVCRRPRTLHAAVADDSAG